MHTLSMHALLKGCNFFAPLALTLQFLIIIFSYTTTRKRNLKNPKVVIDAIMFHGVGLKIEDVKKLKSFRSYISSVNKGVDPLFILFMLVCTMKY